MKKCENKGKIIGAIAIVAGTALIGRIIYDFKKIRKLTKEDALAGEPEETPVEEVPVEETPAEETPVEEAPAEEAPAAETAEETPAADEKAE